MAKGIHARIPVTRQIITLAKAAAWMQSINVK
jgi:hypothetical protein